MTVIVIIRVMSRGFYIGQLLSRFQINPIPAFFAIKWLFDFVVWIVAVTVSVMSRGFSALRHAEELSEIRQQKNAPS